MMYRLLIIEDDKGIAEAIKTQAEMWDIQVHYVQNFRNVMTEFAEFDPHIILLDISLPFLMATIGAVKFEKFPKCRSSLFPLLPII